MKKTQQEINEAIALLKGLKSTMPKRSAFGDDNHKEIDLQIQVLKRELREPEIYNHDCASRLLDVIEWMKGENNDWLDMIKDDVDNWK